MRNRISQLHSLPAPFPLDHFDVFPLIIGHRGAPSLAPENTPASFAAAAASGAQWVELDVRRSAGDTLAVHHDPVTADGSAVVSLDAQALAARGVWTLRDVLIRLPDGLGVDLELKNLPGEPDYDEDQRIVDLLATLLWAVIGQRPLMTSSFNPLTVQRLRESLNAVPTGLLHGPGLRVDAAADLAQALGATVLCSHVDAHPLDAAMIRSVREAGLSVMVWVVDEPETALRLARAGVDALCTNEPKRLVAALAKGVGRG
jgi:glycerophosphoryl diester phosphodiesterase